MRINELAKHNYIGKELIAPFLVSKETESKPEYIPATIKPDWKMPESPFGQVCPECKDKIEPIAHNTGDGWFLGWQCSSGGCEPLLFEDGMSPEIWPFIEDMANWRDLENAGFTIV